MSHIWRVNSFEYKAIPCSLCGFSFSCLKVLCSCLGSQISAEGHLDSRMLRLVGIVRDTFVYILSFPANVFVERWKWSGGEHTKMVRKYMTGNVR